MDELAELHRFNAWANRNLVAGIRQLSDAQREGQPDGHYNSVLGVLRHLANVEHVYLRMVRGQAPERLSEGLTLDELAAVLEEVDAGLVEVARTPPERRVRIPWFERDFSVAQCLRQVLTHSINHRADINQWLPRFGVESVDLDYIDLALEDG